MPSLAWGNLAGNSRRPARRPFPPARDARSARSRQRPRQGLARGFGRKRWISESEIEQTVVAFDVTLKTPTSQQGTAAFCAHLEAGAPLGFEETPQASGLAAAGFFFIWQAEPARRNPN